MTKKSKFDAEAFDFSAVEIDPDAVNQLKIGELKEASKFFDSLSLQSLHGGDFESELEGMQLLLWANLKGEGCTLADTEEIPLGVLAELNSDDSE